MDTPLDNALIRHRRELWEYVVGRVCETTDDGARKLVELVTGERWEMATPRGQIEARMRERPAINPPDWESWAAELDALAGHAYGPKGAIAGCGPACWRESFERGDSPADALNGDMEAWD